MNFSPFWTKNPEPSGNIPVIGFTDATDPRIIQAAYALQKGDLARPLLIGDPDTIFEASKNAGLSSPSSEIVANLPNEEENKTNAALLHERQKKQGVSVQDVSNQLNDPLYQGIAMLLRKKIHGLVSGSLRPTSEVVRAAIQCVGPREGVRIISGHFLVETDQRATLDKTPFLFADCAVVPEPSPRALAAIASGAAASYTYFTGIKARIALLSFSTKGSAQHDLVDRIKEALEVIRKQDPEVIVDGEIQVDAALDADVARIKMAEDSPVSGKANVFVFPTLEAGNIGYKLVQRFSKARIAGPLLWGLNRPMSDLSRGCTIQEILDTARCVSAMAQGMN